VCHISFNIILLLWACLVNRLTIAQAKLVDDKQKLMQGAGGEFSHCEYLLEGNNWLDKLLTIRDIEFNLKMKYTVQPTELTVDGVCIW